MRISVEKLRNFSLDNLGEYTSKIALSKMLGISVRTIYQYHEIAMLISDFEDDYPSITKNSQAISSSELTRYQCWVIFSLILVCRRLSRKNVYECLLKGTNEEFTAKFSKSNYQQLTQNIGDVNNDITTICKAA